MEEHIGEAIERIQERNLRVEADKAWEQSLVRISCISAITYACAATVLHLIGAENFLLSALVPVLGYLLSTQSLPPVRRRWIARYFEKRG